MADKKLDGFHKILFLLVIIYILFIAQDRLRVGTEVDSYLGVPVYYNGFFNENVYGKNYSKQGYYYGLKWQCVEFVQRFYHDILDHRMPDPSKDAKDYFDSTIAQGERNKITGLKQFKNGGEVAPDEKDILVFQGGKYGHVAIITKVETDYVEIMQQNVYGKTKAKLQLRHKVGTYRILSENQLAGWLRK